MTRLHEVLSRVAHAQLGEGMVTGNLVPRAHVSFGADQKTRGLWERDW